MTTLLTITWDENQLFCLCGKTRGKEVVFENAASISLRTATDKSGIFRAVSMNSAKVIPESVENHIRQFVGKNRLAKADAVFVVGRSDVELRSMSFPPIPVEELPEVIRFQAAKEFNRYESHTPLDFFPLRGLHADAGAAAVAKSGGTKTGLIGQIGKTANSPKTGKDKKIASEAGPRQKVLASIIRGELLKEISELCESANLNLKRVVLHPCEATYLLRQIPRFDPEKTYLLVEVDPTEALLTVVHQGQPIFMRSPRLSGERAERTKITTLVSQLQSEIKRTIIAVRNEFQVISVDRAVVLGSTEDHKTLAASLAAVLMLPVSDFDPWENAKLGGTLGKNMPDHPEMYSALIGTALLTARNIPSDIDFHNPKKRPPNLRNKHMTVAVVAGVLVFLALAFGFGIWRSSSLNREVATLRTREARLKEETADVDVKRKLLGDVEAWNANNYDWLAQMDWLSRSVPSAENVMFTNIDFNVTSRSEGRIVLKGGTRDAGVATTTAGRLRDESHEASLGKITSGSPRRSNTDAQYPHPLDITISVKNETKTKTVTDEKSVKSPEEIAQAAETAETAETVETSGNTDAGKTIDTTDARQ